MRNARHFEYTLIPLPQSEIAQFIILCGSALTELIPGTTAGIRYNFAPGGKDRQIKQMSIKHRERDKLFRFVQHTVTGYLRKLIFPQVPFSAAAL